MKKPLNTTIVPRGGWSIHIPETDTTLNSVHPSELLSKVRVHLESNGLDWGRDWKDKVWDMVCEQNSGVECEDSEGVKVRGWDGNDLNRFLKTMWTAWKDGVEPVSQEEQNRRISICLSCPKITNGACAACTGIAHFISQFTIGRKLEKHPDVYNKICSECKCNIESKTMFPVSVLKEVDQKMQSQPDYHSSCWMREEANSNP